MKIRILRLVDTAWLALAGLSLAACSGGISNTNTASSVESATVGGTVTGLSGSGLVLQNNGTDNLTLAANGSFVFQTTLIPGDSYNITVLAQPTAPDQTCVVTNGSGVVPSSGTISVTIKCVDKTSATDTVGGIASGVTGSGLVLQDNGGDNLNVAADGSFTFPTPLASGQPYDVTVLTPPINPYENCVISSGAGITGGDNIGNVVVSCSVNSNPSYTIGGTVSGVSAAEPVVLADNGRNQLTLTANGAFTFSIPIPSGSTYNVTSVPASSQQSQTCTFTNGSGTVANANVSNISVVCKSNVTIGVNVTGLAGSGLVLQDNGTDNLAVDKNGAYVFATALVTGSAYKVTVLSQPSNPTQTCAVQNASGVVGSSPPATVVCGTNSYTLGGTVSGLAGSGLTVQDSGGTRYPITANGPFTIPGVLPSGFTYSIAVSSQPTNPSQTCTVSNPSGTVAGANITNVLVRCVTQAFTVGGTVTGLTGTGLTVKDNGGASYALTANGAFTIPGTVASGAAYAVSVAAQPANPSQTCTVSNGSGTITAVNVVNVLVTCSTRSFTVGGSVTGLAGTGLSLQDDGGAIHPITANGAFTIPGAVASGAPYAVSVASQPTNPSQMCTVSNGLGTVGAADVTNVVVTCVTRTFTVGGTVTGLAGTGLKVKDNGGASYPLTANGAFTIPGTVASGSGYTVSIASQPTNPSQTCTLANPSGTVTTADVINVVVTCVTQAFTVGGTVTGLAGTGLAVKDNLGAAYPITANGGFTIPGTVASGAAYSVTVSAQPSNPAQMCTVTNGGSGTITTANITNVVVTCVTQAYTVGGTVSGLAGTGLVLSNYTNATYAITANGPFTFPGTLTTGSPWSITVSSYPSNPTQVCTANNNNGVIGTANITNVTITCVTQSFTVGGGVTGLPGGVTGLVLQDNGGENLPVAGPAGTAGTIAFTFPSQLSGSTYAVTVFSQPSGYYCVVGNGTGTVGAANVTNVAVTCAEIAGFLYITNSADATISGYVVDENSGDLLPLNGGAIPTGTVTPVSAALGCPFGNTPGVLYVVNEGSSSISQYAISFTSGALTAIAAPVATPGTNPGFIDFMGSTDTGCDAITLYGSQNGASSFYEGQNTPGVLAPVSGVVSLGTGTDPVASTNIQNGSTGFYELVADNAAAQVSVLPFNSATGILDLPSSTVTTGLLPDAIVTQQVYFLGDPTNAYYELAYVANSGSNTISEYGFNYQSDTLSPLLYNTNVLTATTGNAPSALAVVSFTNSNVTTYYLYAANSGDGTVSAYSIFYGATICAAVCPTVGTLYPINADAATNALTIATGGNDPISLTSAYVAGNEIFLYVVNKGSNNVQAFSISPTTGQLTAVGSPVASGASPTSAVYWPAN